MNGEYVHCEGLGSELRNTCRRYLKGKQLPEDNDALWVTACPEDRPYYDRKEFYGG